MDGSGFFKKRKILEINLCLKKNVLILINISILATSERGGNDCVPKEL